ncbi:MAG TPA: hypothetical protein VOA64_00970 [Candidatus Dormibacteraeota bacterium]|nr:hypothetical protein [Candidatus Dormibacteraeota bacterium]
MKAIETFFLRAKHWQIFLLLFVVPTIAEFAAIGFVKTTIRSWNDVDGATLLLLGAMFLYLLCFLAWYWSLGTFLTSMVESDLKLNDGFFRFALLYPLLYMPVFFWIMLSPSLGSAAVLIPLHLFCMFCLLYALYFVSKNLVMAETGKSASFYDYAGPFFLNWFYPIGIWFIQPRVNRLYAERKNAERSVSL